MRIPYDHDSKIEDIQKNNEHLYWKNKELLEIKSLKRETGRNKKGIKGLNIKKISEVEQKDQNKQTKNHWTGKISISAEISRSSK